jgi:hypothetical protein
MGRSDDPMGENMNIATRRAGAAAATLTAAASVLAVTPAATAADLAPSRISVHTRDHDVRSGEMFALRGRLVSEGEGVPGATVRVLAYRNGDWVRLSGAHVTTDSEGRYRVRLVLSQDGDRDLRVVGDRKGDGIRRAHRDTVIRVWA